MKSETQPKTAIPSLSRRGFLSVAGAVPAIALAQSIGGAAFAADAAPSTAPAAGAKKLPFGLELYSVRGELAKNLPETLKAVAKIGYENVEFYAPYLEWKLPYAKTVKTIMDDLNLRCFSTHNNITALTPGKTMDNAIELNQILGSRLIVLASPPGTANNLEGWKKLCGQLTTASEQLATHGLAAGFHNHAPEWAKIDGEKRRMDILAENTPPEFVLQLDVGTCVAAGADPVAWIKANPGRIKVIHLKDWAPGTRADEKLYRVLFGEGVSPWKEILATAEAVGGLEHVLMEQEGSRFPEIETAQKCYDAWKAFRAKA